MTKKVLAIIGSPRKGNTYKAITRVEEKMKEMGNVEFEYLLLKDIDLEPCRGCFLCLSKGEDLCPIDDDRPMIEEKMLAADGILLASPVFAMNMSGLMKKFFDRFAYTFHRPRFLNQHLMVLCTTGGVGIKETLNALAIFQASGCYLVHKIGLATPPFPPSQKGEAKAEKEVEKAAHRFYSALQSEGPPKPTWGTVIQFRAFRTIYPLAKDYFPCDNDY